MFVQIDTLGTFRIADDPDREDMNFSAVHVICHQCPVLSNKENQINSILGELQSLCSPHWQPQNRVQYYSIQIVAMCSPYASISIY
jgi:hypothetical protein